MSVIDHAPTIADVERFIFEHGSDAAAHRAALRMERAITTGNETGWFNLLLCERVLALTAKD